MSRNLTSTSPIFKHQSDGYIASSSQLLPRVCVSELSTQTFVSEAISRVAVSRCTSSWALSSSSFTSLSCWRKFSTSRCNSFRSWECSSCIVFSRSFRKATRQHGRVREQRKAQGWKEPSTRQAPTQHHTSDGSLLLPAFSGFISLSVCRQKMFILKDWMRPSRWHIRFTRNSQFFHKISVFPEQVTSLWIALVMFWFSGASEHFGVSSWFLDKDPNTTKLCDAMGTTGITTRVLMHCFY